MRTRKGGDAVIVNKIIKEKKTQQKLGDGGELNIYGSYEVCGAFLVLHQSLVNKMYASIRLYSHTVGQY